MKKPDHRGCHCCARAATGQAKSVPPRRVMNSCRVTRPLRSTVIRPEYQISHASLKQLLRRKVPTRAVSAGLGCVETQTCCGAIEWCSQASDVLSFSREARLSAPTDAAAEISRLRGSYQTVQPLGEHSHSVMTFPPSIGGAGISAAPRPR